MKDFHKKFYLFFWGRAEDGRVRDENEQRELNEALAVCWTILMWVAIIGLCVITVASRLGAQWAEDSWLVQCLFLLIIFLPMLYPPTRRIVFKPRVLRPEDYAQHMTQQKKGILRGTVAFVVLAMLLMPGIWQGSWLKMLGKGVVILVIFAAMSYLHVRIEARRAMARYEKEIDGIK